MGCKSILIVEDDPDIRTTLKELLELEGYQTFTAANGMDAIQLLENVDHLCLIILDLMMPVMNGWEFLQQIRKERIDSVLTVPVLIMSAAGDEANSAKKLAAGFMKKPVQIDDLLAEVKMHCGLP